jgi:hypothetical protein
VSNVIDLEEYGHTKHWDDNPLSRRVAQMMHRKSWKDRWLAATANKEYSVLDDLDREWEVVESCY